MSVEIAPELAKAAEDMERLDLLSDREIIGLASVWELDFDETDPKRLLLEQLIERLAVHADDHVTQRRI